MIVKFYTVENSAETHKVGTYPQTTSFISDYDKKASTSAYNIRWNELPSFEPDLKGIKIHKNAKVTDVMSFFLGGDYPLLSSKVASILEEFQLPKHKKVEAVLLGEGKKIIYYAFLFESMAIKDLILEECLFATQHGSLLHEEKTFTVSTLAELKNVAVDCMMNGKNLIKKKLVFNSDVLNYDLFNLDFLSGIHISRALMEELQKQKLSGIEFKTVEYVVK